mmetsp:Transcript_28552/g.71505  ORF Transcript_28552/g.71505 Transcript_28552/m.71505 type:complete len:274 (-) Transcript_28552:1066-1887(-)
MRLLLCSAAAPTTTTTTAAVAAADAAAILSLPLRLRLLTLRSSNIHHLRLRLCATLLTTLLVSLTSRSHQRHGECAVILILVRVPCSSSLCFCRLSSRQRLTADGLGGRVRLLLLWLGVVSTTASRAVPNAIVVIVTAVAGAGLGTGLESGGSGGGTSCCASSSSSTPSSIFALLPHQSPFLGREVFRATFLSGVIGVVGVVGVVAQPRCLYFLPLLRDWVLAIHVTAEIHPAVQKCVKSTRLAECSRILPRLLARCGVCTVPTPATLLTLTR